MALIAGTKLGPYEILAPLGAGGMGEVYRAKDSRLDRIVAIKVLPQLFSADADRLRRFEQEARSVAALNHPNILAVHDLGTHDGAPYMVCELLEGETLRERLQGGVLSSRKSIELAIQIAHGLAAAHDKGIVHRDLKPENIFLTRDGRVKILDFGLAKIASGASEANSGQTLTSAHVALTEAGQVLGTAGYMSPEQVRGIAVDHRSDIFAFGAIFFEMLSGKRAFSRDTSAETMTAILKEDPPELTELNRGISPALDRLTRHCLEKNPDQRFQSARDLAFDLDALSLYSGSSAEAIAKPTALQRMRRFYLPLTALIIILAAALGYMFGHKGTSSSEITYHQLTFRKVTVLSARFAPDNRTVIYSAAWGGSDPELFSTRQDSIESRPVGLSRYLVYGRTRGLLEAEGPSGFLRHHRYSGTHPSHRRNRSPRNPGERGMVRLVARWLHLAGGSNRRRRESYRVSRGQGCVQSCATGLDQPPAHIPRRQTDRVLPPSRQGR
jgi:serine/threonine protein kinase